MFPSSEKTLPRAIWLYIVGEALAIYMFVSILHFKVEDNQNWLLGILYLVEFGVHEVSHIIFGFLPSILVAAAGSIGEVSLTRLVLFSTIKTSSYYMAVFDCHWIMLAMHSVGRYIADARAQALPLAGPGETVTHDWNYILGQLGALPSDTFWGGIVMTTGTIIGVAALLWGAYLLVVKAMQLGA